MVISKLSEKPEEILAEASVIFSQGRDIILWIQDKSQQDGLFDS